MASTASYTEQAQVESRPFYCHSCSHQWMKTQNSLFECPRCFQGFIEEVTDDFHPNESSLDDPTSPFSFIFFNGFSPDRNGNRASSRSRNRSRRVRNDSSSSRSRSPHLSIVVGSVNGETIRSGNFRFGFNRSNAASRFLSVAIDDIMSSIFTSDRQPALSQEQLEEIPQATITAEQVEAQLQCAVCFEDFNLNENEVRKLLCNHFFHEKCIFPWLRNNASCPVCRTQLPNATANTGADTDEELTSVFRLIADRRHNRSTSMRRREAAEQSRNNNVAGPSTSSSSRTQPQGSTLRHISTAHDDNSQSIRARIMARRNATETRPTTTMRTRSQRNERPQVHTLREQPESSSSARTRLRNNDTSAPPVASMSHQNGISRPPRRRRALPPPIQEFVFSPTNPLPIHHYDHGYLGSSSTSANRRRLQPQHDSSDRSQVHSRIPRPVRSTRRMSPAVHSNDDNSESGLAPSLSSSSFEPPRRRLRHSQSFD